MSDISSLAVRSEDTEAWETLNQLRIVTYAYTGAVVILIFDYLLTVGDEVEFIWKRKWGVGKILFFLVRYPVFSDAIGSFYSQMVFVSAKYCRNMQVFTIFSNVVGSSLSEFILVLRTYALWNCDKKILIFLLAIWTASTMVNFILSIEFIRPEQFGPTLAHAAPGCAIITGVKPMVALAEYICITISETVILALTIYPRFTTFRHSKSPIFDTIYHDGIIYFVYSFLSSIVNICCLAAAPVAVSNLFVLTHRVLHCTFSTRILLHLHQASQVETVDINDGTNHTLEFAAMGTGRSLTQANSATLSSILEL